MRIPDVWERNVSEQIECRGCKFSGTENCKCQEIQPFRRYKHLTLCVPCDCPTCIYNAEMGNITNDMDDADYCYRCEYCVEYGGKIEGTERCERYAATKEFIDYMAEKKRKKLRICERGWK